LRLFAAGAVVGEAGSCMIEFGIYTAHFTIYQTDSRDNQEFCEDLPDTGSTLFVMDYLHGDLDTVPVDFRIIRDTEDWGIFARWDNVRQIEDIDARTVFFQPGVVATEQQLTAEHDFREPGGYIGIVSAPHPSKDLHYHAVFPFQVGKVNWFGWMAVLFLPLAGLAWWWRSRSDG
jgi:hypothetical protein